jgi:hypothetical protein
VRNKGILSLITVGVLALSLSTGTVKAEEVDSVLAKKAIENHIEKPLKQGIVDVKDLNELTEEIKSAQPGTVKSFSASSTSSNADYIFEQEPNDDFRYANQLFYDIPTIGQLLPEYDVDFHKVDVPNDGFLLVGGTTNNIYAIDLLFIATERDWNYSGKLEYLGSEYEDDIEIQAYYAKAGTYYVPVIDAGGLYENTEDDLYLILTKFVDDVDDVAPSKPTVNMVGDNSSVVKGKAEADSTVIVKVGNTQIGSAKASSNGNFSVTIKKQKAGTTLTVYAKDSAGNISEGTSIKVVDVTPPSKPTVNKVNNKDKVVTGKAEANSKVTVKAGSKVLGTATATSKGTFSVSIKVQKAGTKLTITAKDGAGNVSKSASTTVIDVIPPSRPTINKVRSTDKVVTGKAEANSKVTVKVGSKTLGSATANSKGKYSVKIAPQKKGTTISVTAKDKAGNVSKAATTKVVKP